ADPPLAVAPAEVHLTVVDEGGKVDQAELQVLRHAPGGEHLPETLPDLPGGFAQARLPASPLLRPEPGAAGQGEDPLSVAQSLSDAPRFLVRGHDPTHEVLVTGNQPLHLGGREVPLGLVCHLSLRASSPRPSGGAAPPGEGAGSAGPAPPAPRGSGGGTRSGRWPPAGRPFPLSAPPSARGAGPRSPAPSDCRLRRSHSRGRTRGGRGE